MLPLSDPRWAEFKANYTDGAQVANLLARVEAGEELDGWYDDLFQEVCHQYTVSEAAYPAAPHLVRLASAFEAWRKPLLILLGSCHAFCEPEKLRPMAAGIEEAWERSAKEAIPLLAEELKKPQPSESEMRYLLSSLAAVSGYPSLARAMEGLDSEEE